MIIRILLSSIFILSTLSCSVSQPDRRLDRVNDLASTSPQEALDSLAAIDYTQLSDADKHYYDFLSIKASDKAYIMHKSDSLILKVIDFESKHQGNGRYPEALYYGGRVYSDLGDYPTALHYYQNALDRLPTDTESKRLKTKVLTQLGHLLNILRLYKQAIPYIEEAIRIDSAINDSLNLMYDIQQLGAVHLRAKNYDTAESLFKQARLLAKSFSPSEIANQEMQLAAIKYYKNQIDSALFFIRPVMKDIDSISRNTASAYACIIYHKANIPDTALIYANELIQRDQLNRRTGYQIALASDMLKYLPKDSLLRYISKYRDAMETDLSQNGIQEALIQNSFYNYQLHQRKRLKAETANENLHKWIIAILLIVFALTVCVLYLKYRNKSQLVQLHEAINNVNILRQALESDKNSANETATGHASTSESDTVLQPQSVQNLRARLRDELLSLQNNGGNTSDISPIILNSREFDIRIPLLKKWNNQPFSTKLSG